MVLTAKSNETNESLDDEDSKMKSYITKQFKKFMKNVNMKGFDKDRKQSSSSQFKSQDRGKKDAIDGSQYTIPSGPKCFRCQGFGNIKQESPTYLKSIGKSKAFAVTLSDTEPETELDDSDDEGILSAFTATVDPTKGIIEKWMKKRTWWNPSLRRWMNKMTSIQPMQTRYLKKHEKLYRLSTKKLRKVEMERDEQSTKVDEANQTIGALRFENNFLAKKTKKLEAKLFQVRAQLERTSSTKLDDMLNLQKSTSDRTGLGYKLSNSSHIASSSKTIFVSPANNENLKKNETKTEIASENNLDKGKSILRAPPKIKKKETRNPMSNKAKNKKSQPKKLHFCHHCGASRHIRPNCYKWLTIQQSNSVLSSGGQGQIPPSLGPLGDLLKAFMFLLNINGFNSSPPPPEQRFNSRKGSSSKTKVRKEKGQSDSVTFSLSLYVFALLVCFAFLFLSQSSFMLYMFTCVCLFVFCFFFFFLHKNKKLKNQKNTKIMCVCVYWYLCTLDDH